MTFKSSRGDLLLTEVEGLRPYVMEDASCLHVFGVSLLH